jgi:peroxiredoxin
MVSLLLLILTVLFSALVERVAVIALEITGLQEDQAEFQAVSALSGTGFATQEAELIINHPERRKIIQTIMGFGSAGIIASIATLVGTLVSSSEIFKFLTFDTDILGFKVPLPVAILSLIVALLFLAHQFLSKPGISRLLKEIVTQWLLQGHIINAVQYEEFTVCANGFGIIQVEICEKNPLMGKTIAEAKLSEKGVQVLNIDKVSKSVVNPDPAYEIELGDRLICFGPMSNIKKSCYARSRSRKNSFEIADEPLAVGSEAPLFELQDQGGNTFRLADYLGKKNVILLFYPKDGSFGCSSQLSKFDAHADEFDSLDIVVAAVNFQSAESHAAFAHQLQAELPILTDPEKKVCRAYKALLLKGFLVNRTVYAINKEGRICYAKRGNPPTTEAVRALQAGNLGNGNGHSEGPAILMAADAESQVCDL